MQAAVIVTMVSVVASLPQNFYSAPHALSSAPHALSSAPAVYNDGHHLTGSVGLTGLVGHENSGYQNTNKFEYAINNPLTGTKYSRSEETGPQVVTGQYSVDLPDGRTQHVRYVADRSGMGGYNAVVTYEGVAHHPEPRPADIYTQSLPNNYV